jgi:hypothetical protein
MMMTVGSTELSKILSSQPTSRPKFVFRANVVFHVSQLLRAAERTLKTPDDEPRVKPIALRTSVIRLSWPFVNPRCME